MSKFLFSNSVLYKGIRHSSLFVFSLVLFSAIIYVRSANDDLAVAFLITFVNAVFFFAYGYETVFLLVPKLFFKRHFVLFILAFIGSGLLLSFLKLHFSGFLYATSFAPAINVEAPSGSGWRHLLVNTKDMSFIVAVFAMAKYTKDWLYAERQRKMIESRNAEVQLKLLQSQFDPHFLFNTLNNLYALSLQQSDKTVEVIRKLKMILNYLLVDGQKERVSLNEEIDLIKNYLFIEQIRYGERLKIEFEAGAFRSETEIAPMLLFPIIENCFKHGSSMDIGNPWIKIALSIDKGRLLLLASNSVSYKRKSGSLNEEGKGVEMLKKRLNLLYPEAHLLRVDEQKKEYRLQLEIDLK